MRKVLLLGAVLAMSLVFAFSSFAQEGEGEVTCTKCAKGCDLPSIGCVLGGQQENPCYPTNIDWDCFTFPVCECPDTELYFREGEYIGVRMHILTPGVYWAEGPATLAFRAYKSLTASCDFQNPERDFRMGEFTNVLYFPDETCDPDQAEVVEYHNECTWDDEDYSKLKSLAQNADEALFQIPADWEGYSYWSIQIPAIRIDVAEVLAAQLQGETVKIRIEFVRAGEGGICQGDCQVICECVIEVATLCTETGGDSGGCIYFPYVITQYPPWATGVAISNMGSVAAQDMVATFTLTDKDGKAFTYLKDDFTTTNWSNVLDNMLGMFQGDGAPAPGPSWLKIDTNFAVDGYQFVTDGVFGGSTLGRICGGCDGALYDSK